MIWVSSTREPRFGSTTISHRTTPTGYPACFHSYSNSCGASAAVTFPADTADLVANDVPPKVEYILTGVSRSLEALLAQLRAWDERYRGRPGPEVPQPQS